MAGSRNEEDAMSHRHRPGRRESAPDRERPVLSDAERSLADAFERTASRLAEFARALRSGDPFSIDASGDAFDAATADALRRFEGVNMLPILALPSTASVVAAAVLAEQESLGAPWAARDAAGAAIGPGDGLYDDIAETLSRVDETLAEIERADLPGRIDMIGDEGSICAAVEAGAHIARGGANAPFYTPAWEAATLGVSLFAANVAAAALARFAAASGAILAKGVAEEAAHAAGAVFLSLTEFDRQQLYSFNSPSRVVERLLMDSGLTDGFSTSDIHRISAVLLPAFIVGYNGYEYTSGDEPSAPGRRLIAAACAAGMDTAGIAADWAPEMPEMPPTVAPRKAYVN